MKKVFLFLFVLVFMFNSCKKEDSNPVSPTTESVTYAGKIYNTVKIGNQVWLKENLDVGTRINGSENPSNNGKIEKYCYNDNPAYCDTFGALYQWNEAMAYYSTTPGTQGICPPGWHIPIRAEFETLKVAVNNDANSLKSIGQGTGNGKGTNTSGFSALLSGYRDNNGSIDGLAKNAYFWSSTENNSNNAYFLDLFDNVSYIDLTYVSKVVGFSIRCLKN